MNDKPGTETPGIAAAIAEIERRNGVVHSTPGPWTYERKPDRERMALAKRLGVSIDLEELVEYELRTVASVEHTPKLHGPTYLGIINKEADARLIAAAPDLFEACAELVFIMGGEDSKCPSVTKARALIARAEGRP